MPQNSELWPLVDQTLQCLHDPLGWLEPVGVDAARLAVDAPGFGQPVVDTPVLGAEGAGEEVEFLLGEEGGADEVVGSLGTGSAKALHVFDKDAAVEPAAGVEVAIVDGGDGALIDLLEGGAEEFDGDDAGDSAGDDPADAAVAGSRDAGVGQAVFFNDENDVRVARADFPLVGELVTEAQVPVSEEVVVADHASQDALVEFLGGFLGKALVEEAGPI